MSVADNSYAVRTALLRSRAQASFRAQHPKVLLQGPQAGNDQSTLLSLKQGQSTVILLKPTGATETLVGCCAAPPPFIPG
jgi:hypothetical protein